MNIFGMGTFELLVVLIVAFIVLGPARMVDAAKVMGRLINEARKITQAIPEIVSDEDPTGLNDEKNLDKSTGSNIDVGDQTDDGKITTSSFFYKSINILRYVYINFSINYEFFPTRTVEVTIFFWIYKDEISMISNNLVC